jgi:hypothetical protein
MAPGKKSMDNIARSTGWDNRGKHGTYEGLVNFTFVLAVVM